jgi:hypothetical protein
MAEDPIDGIAPVLRNIQAELVKVNARLDEGNVRTGKIEKDIQGLMEILVGIAGTLRILGERVRHLEEAAKA